MFVLDNDDRNEHPKTHRLMCYSDHVHRFCCTINTLIVIYYLLMCYFSFSSALDDMNKYRKLGFSHSFSHYLIENALLKNLCFFVPALAEFFLFLFLYRHTGKRKDNRRIIFYSCLFVFFHTSILLHGVSLDFPQSPPYVTTDGIGKDYYDFACITGFQSVLNLISHLVHIKHLSKNI